MFYWFYSTTSSTPVQPHSCVKRLQLNGFSRALPFQFLLLKNPAAFFFLCAAEAQQDFMLAPDPRLQYSAAVAISAPTPESTALSLKLTFSFLHVLSIGFAVSAHCKHAAWLPGCPGALTFSFIFCSCSLGWAVLDQALSMFYFKFNNRVKLDYKTGCCCAL